MTEDADLPEQMPFVAMATAPQPGLSIRIMINGEWHEVPQGTTVGDLLRQWGLAGKPVAVERNLQVIPHALHEETVLAEGDRLEIVTLVGGG